MAVRQAVNDDPLRALGALTAETLRRADIAHWPPSTRGAAAGLVLSDQGQVERAFVGADDATAFVLHIEPGRAAALGQFLVRMKFMMRVEHRGAADVAVT